MKPTLIIVAAFITGSMLTYLLLRRTEPEAFSEASFEPPEHSTRSANVRLAPLYFWHEDPPDQKAQGRMRDAARITVRRGVAFANDVELPVLEIKHYLNERVAKKEISTVIVFPTADSKWGEIFPVINECRRSKVRTVFLNK